MKKTLTLLLFSIFFIIAFNSVHAATYDSCINNTTDAPECKDCCDCLDTDADTRGSCRDTCATHDFSSNSDFITVEAPSTLGPDGDYSTAVDTGTEQACKKYCDDTSELSCGDRRYCRDACNAADFTDPTDPTDPGDSNISIDQAISKEAQTKTIAFSSLAFLTGDLCSYTFFPPGKVSDFFGFQYRRDITPNGFGHNTEFAGRISDSVLSILTDAQVQALVTMANEQAYQVDDYGYKRFVLIKAFKRLLENDVPDGASGLDKSAVMNFTGDLYEIDGEISYTRAVVIGGIVEGLSDTQKTELTELLVTFNKLFEDAGEGGTINNEDWPPSSQVDLSGITVNDGRVLVSTYATQLFSWYVGSVEGDTYFCPERHGTYFGSFYMKDIPPLTATEPVTIDSNLTADMGVAFLNALDSTQETLITGLADIQKTTLDNIVSKRGEISAKLRLFMDGTSVDKSEILSMVREYGEYEGDMMYYYATNFATVGNTLTDAQADTLMGLRLDYYKEFPDYQANSNAYDCSGAWLYASKVDMPEIMNTDFLFTAGAESPPSVYFSFSPSTPTPGETVQFTDLSSGSPSSWSWSFSDGGTETSQDPSHVFTNAGTYTVTLTATNAFGTGTPVSKSITVTDESSDGVTAGTIEKLADGFTFTEGPAADASGNIFFTDIPASRIHKWSTGGQLTTFLENSGGANGLFFDSQGNLLACQGGNSQLVSIDLQGNVTVLADTYDNNSFNQLNDLWIDPRGGVYFSDPVYGDASVVQGGEHVYYLTPKRDNVMRVIDDMVRPNGIIGTSDGTTLYVTDHGAGKTYSYTISENGSLSDKTLFVSKGGDGMTIDSEGNIYLAEDGILVYDSTGNQIDEIAVPEQTTNVCFGGSDGQTLFITAGTSLYSIQMRVKGVSDNQSSDTEAGDIDKNGDVNISDAVSALQIMAGVTPVTPVSKEADVNGDSIIGLQELVYILQKVSEDPK
ncbi:MAG: PKD domain-containing protein [Desulfobacterales bacterium]|nr:PKD domain-containing protein [Desulfobacterales bacterium]